MRLNIFLLRTIALLCLASQAYAQTELGGSSGSSTMGSGGDWLSPGDFSSFNFPWYSSGGTFYSQGFPDNTFRPFREFYVPTGTPVVGGIISNPASFDIAQRTPSRIYYGNGQALPYSQYVSTVPSKTNDLWVQGATNWTQYVVSPLGTWLQLVANAPAGGPAPSIACILYCQGYEIPALCSVCQLWSLSPGPIMDLMNKRYLIEDGYK
jgi:hypothetical protein